MDVLKKFFNPGALTKIVGVCVALGFILAIGKALLFVHSNHYFEFHMYNIAFDAFLSIVNDFTLIFTFSTFVVFLIIFLYYSVFSYFLKDWIKGERYTCYTILATALLGILLVVGYRLNHLSWYPDFLSVRGIIYNTIVGLSFIFLGVILGVIFSKTHFRIRGFLLPMVPRISGLRFVLGTLLLLLMLNGLFYFHQIQMDGKGLNVLFISVDTLRADHIGIYGYVRDTSPNIDKLAEEGTLFSQAFTQWPQTVGSLASILTSTYRHYHDVNRMWRDQLSNDYVLLPEILKNAGYNTIGVTPYLAVAHNFHQGFDTSVKTWQKFSKNYDAEEITEYAISWLKDNAGEKKFFMWLHYDDPHVPYKPPGPYNELYLDDKHYNGSKRIQFNPGRHDRMRGISPRVRLGNHDEVDYYVAQYDGEIRYMDESVGKLLDAIKTMGLSDNTMIIFTADHGESLGDHDFFFGHGLLPYDASFRVPLIVKIPDLKSKVKVLDRPVELIDIMPTILDVLNISVNKEAQGKSLVPLMLGDSNAISEFAFGEAGVQKTNHQRVIRTRKWKLIYIPSKAHQQIMLGMPFELYDIENDPNELNNLIEVETQVAEELKKELFRWMESTKRKVR